MPKRNLSLIDAARQALLKGVKRAAKSAQSSQRRFSKGINKKAKQITKERNVDYVLKWRELKKLGLIKTKNNPAQKNLTPRLKSKINKEFHAMQGGGFYAKGKVTRPLKKESYKTKSGKTKQRYTLDDNFKFIRSKKDLGKLSGVIKTKNGYIVEDAKGAKVSVRKNTLYVKKGNRVYKRMPLSGSQIVQFQNAIEKGDFKLRPGERLVYRPFGSERVEQAYEPDTLDNFIEDLNKYESVVRDKGKLDAWLNKSEVLIMRGNYD